MLPVEQIFKNSGQVHFEMAPNYEKFTRHFCDLYRIELFKTGLDLILTKVKNKKLKFEIKIIKNWDTNVGCCISEEHNVFDKIRGIFVREVTHKIILREITHNVLAHEMAHALEKSSNLNFNEEFRKSIGFDMKNREPQFITLKAQMQRLMVDQVKNYPQNQILSELFSRYFELLSLSRNVIGNGEFTTKDVTDFFANTTNYINKIFNIKIKNQIDPEISEITTNLVKKLIAINPERRFADNVDSFHKKTGIESKSKWTGNVKSNAAWQKSWENFKGIEGKKGDK